MFGMPIQIEVVNGGIDWLNNLFTIFSVFIGAILAYFFTKKHANHELRTKFILEKSVELSNLSLKLYSDLREYKMWVSAIGRTGIYNIDENYAIILNEKFNKVSKLLTIIGEMEFTYKIVGFNDEEYLEKFEKKIKEISNEDRKRIDNIYAFVKQKGVIINNENLEKWTDELLGFYAIEDVFDEYNEVLINRIGIKAEHS